MILALPFMAALIAGCKRDASVVREWQTSDFSGIAMGFKLKDQNPSATGSQAYLGGKLLGSAGLKVRDDKSFELIWMGMQMDGTWSFNEESKELSLNVARSQGLLGQQGLPINSYLARYDGVTDSLRLYPGGKELMDLAKGTNSPMADGIALQRKG